MKKPDVVLRELGQLYDFQKEIEKFRFREKGETEPHGPAVPDGRASPRHCPNRDRDCEEATS